MGCHLGSNSVSPNPPHFPLWQQPCCSGRTHCPSLFQTIKELYTIGKEVTWHHFVSGTADHMVAQVRCPSLVLVPRLRVMRGSGPHSGRALAVGEPMTQCLSDYLRVQEHEGAISCGLEGEEGREN